MVLEYCTTVVSQLILEPEPTLRVSKSSLPTGLLWSKWIVYRWFSGGYILQDFHIYTRAGGALLTLTATGTHEL